MSWQEILDKTINGLQIPLTYFYSPDKRLHFLYLASSCLLMIYLLFKAKTTPTWLSIITSKRLWLSKSALTDYGIFFLNGLVKIFLIAPYIILGSYLAFSTNEWLLTYFSPPQAPLDYTSTLLLYSLSIAILGDFASFLLHYAFHKIPFLWEFHKVHHSATVLTPITQYRIHPIELILNNIKGILVFGVVTGVFDYLSNHQIRIYTFFGVNIFVFLFLLWGSNLRHSPIPLTYFNVLEYLFISPYQHQIHHSDNPSHFNKNMGAKLAIWDWIFGTLLRSNEVKSVQFGLGKEMNPIYTTFLKNIYMPFIAVFYLIRRIFIK